MDTVNGIVQTCPAMLTLRGLVRSTFRFAATITPPPEGGEDRSGVVDPRHLVRAGLLAARRGAELVDTLLRGEARVGSAYVELENKVRAFHLFEAAPVLLDLDGAPLLPAQAIREAESRLGHEASVWATEGIGYELVERRRNARRPVLGLLSDADDGVPPGSWTTLHTGMGMALADHSLPELCALSARSLRQALAEYVQTCAGAARAGYAEIAFEPLGLVARLLEPALVAALGAALAEMGGPWSELFWHGVGRGLYFLPANLPPTRSAPWAGLRSSLEEPPAGRSRQNAAAGFSWAVTLVNLRHPQVVEGFLAHHAEPGMDQSTRPADSRSRADGTRLEGPVAQGVACALQLWHEASGGPAELRRFVGHVPAEEQRAVWERVVRLPLEAALVRRTRPVEQSDPHRLSELFRYR